MRFTSANLILVTSILSTQISADATTDAILCASGLLSRCTVTAPAVQPITVPALFSATGFSCQSGFNLVGQTCVAASSVVIPTTASTPANPAAGTNLNCGTTNSVCSSVNNGQLQCVSGSCSVLTCNQGYTAVSGVCQATTSSNNVAACGAAGVVCQATGNPRSVAQCTNGVCTISGCASGFVFQSNTCQALTIGSNPNACGTSLMQCPGTNTGGGICNNGVCAQSGCNSPLVNNVCRDPVVAASQAVKVKRSKVIPTICPGSETACPIVGSAAFVLAQANSFKDFKSLDVTALTRAGGYECLDTKFSIESCGGCVSMGEGTNCLEIAKSSGVGCSAGQCVIYSCQAGFRPNATASKCIRAATHRRSRATKLH